MISRHTRQARILGWRLLGVIIGAVILALGLTVLSAWLWPGLPAFSHEAPSGWRYPEMCCADRHCHPVECSSIEEHDGGFMWRGLPFTRSQTKLSGDGQCHVCADWSGLTPITPRCLFLDHGS